jgi:hypothetical protein
MTDTKMTLLAIAIALVIGTLVGAFALKGCSGPVTVTESVVVLDTTYLPAKPDTVIVREPVHHYVPMPPVTVDGDCDTQIAVRDSIIDSLAYQKWQCENVAAEAVIDHPLIAGSVLFSMQDYARDPQAAFTFLDLQVHGQDSLRTQTITECNRTWWDSLKDYALAGSLIYITIKVLKALLSTH